MRCCVADAVGVCSVSGETVAIHSNMLVLSICYETVRNLNRSFYLDVLQACTYSDL